MNQSKIEAMGEGATGQTELSRTRLGLEIYIPCPTILEQQRIAAILSAYDEFIENSLQRAKILEEMVRKLYREWFVDFRFPGHDLKRLAASHLGLIPEGWRLRPIESFCSFVSRGVTPKYEEGSGVYIINQKVNRGASLSLNDLKELETTLHVPLDKFARFGDVLINCLGEGTIGRVHFYAETHKNWAVDQHMSICRSEKISDALYVYCAMESDEGQARIAALKTGGTNMTMFNISALRTFKLVSPPDSLLIRFADIALPILRQKQTLIEMGRTLRQTHELLLSRLLSGMTKISIIEPRTEKVVLVSTKEPQESKRIAPDEFKEAVLIAEMVRKFSSSRFPLGRMRYNKFSYLAHRKVEDNVQKHYLKQAAGPYSPWAKYEGPEAIAIGNGYIIHARVGQYDGFLPGPKIADIDRYLSNYPTCGAVDWVAENFRYKKKEELELFTTVDFAVIDLQQTNKPVTVGNIKQVIAANPKWAPKLDRDIFSDENISKALEGLQGWFPALYGAQVA